MSRIRFAAVLIVAMAASASAQDPQATPAESLREAWIGKLNMGGVEPVMQFRIMDIATGEPWCTSTASPKAAMDSAVPGAARTPR